VSDPLGSSPSTREGRGSEPLVSSQSIRDHKRAAASRWRSAVRAFDPYAERLRELAEAANGQARVIRYAELGNVFWTPIENARSMELAEGLEADGGREGPPRLWKQFDERLLALGMAMETSDSRAVADAFEALRDAAFAIADALDPAGAEPVAQDQTG
jgi:hypothetical protein